MPSNYLQDPRSSRGVQKLARTSGYQKIKRNLKVLFSILSVVVLSQVFGSIGTGFMSSSFAQISNWAGVIG